MKISGYTPSDIPGSKTPTASAPKAELNPAQLAKSSATDSRAAVVVTSSLRSSAKDPVSQTPDIDTKKVETMRAAIKNGTFVVNPQAIADKLLSNARELHTPQ